MTTTLQILETSYPEADSPPQTTTTMTGCIAYDGCWASSGTLEFVVVDDRLAANPINHLDPTGLYYYYYDTSILGPLPDPSKGWNYADLKAVQGAFIANRGHFRASIYRTRGSARANITIRFYPNNDAVDNGRCTQIRFVQIMESFSAEYYLGRLFNDTALEDAIDAAYPSVLYPHDYGGWNLVPGSYGRYAQMTDGPGTSPSWNLKRVTFSFRTYAVATKGPEAGHSYGYLHWGGIIDFADDWATIFIDGIGTSSGKASSAQNVNWVSGAASFDVGPKTVNPHPGDLAGQLPYWSPLTDSSI